MNKSVINVLDEITSCDSLPQRDCLHDLNALSNIFDLNKGFQFSCYHIEHIFSLADKAFFFYSKIERLMHAV